MISVGKKMVGRFLDSRILKIRSFVFRHRGSQRSGGIVQGDVSQSDGGAQTSDR